MKWGGIAWRNSRRLGDRGASPADQAAKFSAGEAGGFRERRRRQRSPTGQVAPSRLDRCELLRQASDFVFRFGLSSFRKFRCGQSLTDAVSGQICEVGWPRRAAYRRCQSLFAPLREHWQQAGLVVFEGDPARLTLPGRFWYSNLIAAFNDIISGSRPLPR